MQTACSTVFMEVSAQTLRLCMHEHYEDCPWREQSLYAMDSRNQMLFGYYAFGEYDFPESSIRLLYEGMHEDGNVSICAPTDSDMVIPSFTMFWVLELEELVRFSGRLNTGRELLDGVKRVVRSYAAHIDGRTNLLHTPDPERYWNFYEWAPGLDGDASLKSDYDAPLHAMYALALQAAERLAHWVGDDGFAAECGGLHERLAEGFHSAFWSGGAAGLPDGAGRRRRILLYGDGSGAGPVRAPGTATAGAGVAGPACRQRQRTNSHDAQPFYFQIRRIDAGAGAVCRSGH